MPEYEDSKPFRVWYSEPVGRVPESLGTRLKTQKYRTLEEARAAANCLPDSCSFIRLTDGPDNQLIEYNLARALRRRDLHDTVFGSEWHH
jgi:hypothetical protein